MNLPIYLDYAATTPVDAGVADKMSACLTAEGNFANPASRSHIYGWRAEEAVEQARSQVAEAVGAESREIIWTSGATEANNLAIKGLIETCCAQQQKMYSDLHIVTSAIEHKSVLDTCAWLERQGVQVTYLQPDAQGQIQTLQLEQAITDKTVIASIMHVNNELGTVNDIAALGAVCQQRNVVFHVDAAQSIGKLPIDVKTMPVDMVSFSAHKIYGPKGVGALYVRRALVQHPAAQIHGGGQERNMRSGTLPTHQLVGMGEALALAAESLQQDEKHLSVLRKVFLDSLNTVEGVYVNGHDSDRVPGIINLSFVDVEGESLLLALKDIAVSSGSACASATVDPSYVLLALGVERELALSSIRFSFGRYTSEADVVRAAEHVKLVVERLRPLYAGVRRLHQAS